jgi:hypothetical protein
MNVKVKKENSIFDLLKYNSQFDIYNIKLDDNFTLKNEKNIYYDKKSQDIYIIINSNYMAIIDNSFNIERIMLSNIYIEHDYISSDKNLKIFIFSNSRSTLIFNSIKYKYNKEIYLPISYIRIKNKDIDGSEFNFNFRLLDNSNLNKIIHNISLNDKKSIKEIRSYLSKKELNNITDNYSLIETLCEKRKNMIDVNMRFKINRFIVETIQNTII